MEGRSLRRAERWRHARAGVVGRMRAPASHDGWAAGGPLVARGPEAAETVDGVRAAATGADGGSGPGASPGRLPERRTPLRDAASARPQGPPVWLRWCLGGLWLLDGLLQLQPPMFGSAVVRGVLQPALAGNPRWADAPLALTIRVFAAYPVLVNAQIAAAQLAIGLSLLLWGRRRAWPFWLSLGWGVLLWPFGQAFGGVLATGASLWTGAPGSAAGYALLTWAAWPLPALSRGPRAEREGASGPPIRAASRALARRRSLIRQALGLVWAVGAALQAQAAFFTSPGLSHLVTAGAAGEPAWLAALLLWMGHAVAGRAALCNAASVALFAACAIGLWTRCWRRPALWLSIGLAGLAWVFGQALGALLSGMATDPNTAPLLVLVALSVWPRRPFRPDALTTEGPPAAAERPRSGREPAARGALRASRPGAAPRRRAGPAARAYPPST